MARLISETKGTVVTEDLRLADGIWSRFWGLMGRKSLPEGAGQELLDGLGEGPRILWIPNVFVIRGLSRCVGFGSGQRFGAFERKSG